MSPGERWFPSHLKELDKAECLELLATHQVGRWPIATTWGRPVVLPVNYVVDLDTVLLRMSPRSTRARNLRSASASFEVDDFDDDNQSGWSVLVRGDAAHVDFPELPDEDNRPIPWAEGERTLHIRITPHDITGRRLLPA